MNSRGASAPGKAVLCGEYAVLGGAPAIAMAVDRRARVQLAASESEFHSVRSPGLHESTLLFRGSADGAIHWLNDAPARADCALLEHVWRCVRPSVAGSCSLTLDTREFFDPGTGTKVGFGSSAALAVALTAALGGKDVPETELYRTATAAHRSLQDGKGSGVDIATAVFGGLIGFIVHEPVPHVLQWPAGLEFGFFWSGKPVSTAVKLAQFERIQSDGGTRASARKFAAAAAEVYDTWQTGAGGDVLDSLRTYVAALRQFGVDHDLGVFDAGHQTLFDEATRRGLVYKPCGAGGGDVGVVFALQRSAVTDFAECATNYGFESMDILPDPRGVVYEA